MTQISTLAEREPEQEPVITKSEYPKKKIGPTLPKITIKTAYEGITNEKLTPRPVPRYQHLTTEKIQSKISATPVSLLKDSEVYL
jgi:hypothetical protein